MTPEALAEIRALYLKRQDTIRTRKIANAERRSVLADIRNIRERHGLSKMQFSRLGRGVIRSVRARD